VDDLAIGGTVVVAEPVVEPSRPVAPLSRRAKLSWVRADGPSHTVYLVYGLAAVIYFVTALKSPAFFNGGKIESVFVLASVLGVLALSQQLVLILGGVDLSLPWTMNMGAVLIAYFPHTGGLQSIGGLVATLGCGLAVGLVNGFGVAVVGISPIIMTLGMNGLVEGLVQVLTNGQGFLNAPNWVRTLGSGSTLAVPNILIAWGVIAILAVVVLGRTTSGARLYATGSGKTASLFAGLRVKQIIFTAYTFDALLATFAGILLCGYVGESYLGMGDPYLFTSVAAAVIGGVSIYGGQGSYIGVIGGALTLTLLGYLFAAFDLGQAASDVAFGLIVALVVGVSGARRLTGRGQRFAFAPWRGVHR
jgi:ribose transport system permease protein